MLARLSVSHATPSRHFVLLMETCCVSVGKLWYIRPACGSWTAHISEDGTTAQEPSTVESAAHFCSTGTAAAPAGDAYLLCLAA